MQVQDTGGTINPNYGAWSFSCEPYLRGFSCQCICGQEAHIWNVIWTFTCFVFFHQLFTRCSEQTMSKISVRNDVAHLASSNSSISNIFSFLYCSKNAFRLRSLSNWSSIRLNNCGKVRLCVQNVHKWLSRTDEMLVWFANIRPLTRWFVVTYGDRLVSATWIEAGPQGMKLAICRSRMRNKDWWTCNYEHEQHYTRRWRCIF